MVAQVVRFLLPVTSNLLLYMGLALPHRPPIAQALFQRIEQVSTALENIAENIPIDQLPIKASYLSTH